ncbi:Wzz/FepE/Etk N-terminal domain-containing protein [Zobellella denitrificans]|uniref:Wzz/FepE/Etk N-terminal domain-containing protein n=1 Tax=Zobellella denitrificans TaxID=347534 RepID=UPI0012FD1007|nr:Wzz/FepE/Etk N-terminal domain-containing protein [Zobellella denitrificans]
MNKQQLPQDAQFAQPLPPYHYRDDEISLVDLAKILVKRRNWLLATFILVFLASLAIAWLKRPQPMAEDQVAFTTLLAVGYKSPTVFVEPLSGIKTQLESAFIPRAHGSKKFSVDIEVENNNNIIKLITVAPLEQKEEVTSYHDNILSPLLARHEQMVVNLTEQLKMSAATSELQPLNSSVASVAQPLPATQPKDKTKLIAALGFMLAIMFSVIAAFMREFIGKVCASLGE